MCCLGSRPHALFQHSRARRTYKTAMRASFSATTIDQQSEQLALLAASSLSSGQETIMRGPSAGSTSTTSRDAMAATFKRELLKNLLLGLRSCSFDAMSLHDRKLVVKRSADVAMAAARGGGRARWPTAILSPAAADGSSSSPAKSCKVGKKSRCKRVVRRCIDAKRMRRDYYYAAAARSAAATTSTEVARRMVRRRTMALRKVIPGGDVAGDEAALLREAMDYVVHLRAQVDVLRRVSAAVQTSSTVLRGAAQSMGES